LNVRELLTLENTALNGGHHWHGDGTGGGLTNEEKSEEENDDGRKREEHCRWRTNEQESGQVAGGFWGCEKTVEVKLVEPAAYERTRNEGLRSGRERRW